MPPIVVAADPAELVRAMTKQGAVVDDAAMLETDGRVDHLPHRQLADVAGKRALEQVSASGPRTSNLRKGERSIATQRSRQAQYSSIGPACGEGVAAASSRDTR